MATGRCKMDPTHPLRGKSGALPSLKGKHFAATLDPKRLGQILKAMHDYTGSSAVSAALRLQPLVFVRPGELRKAEWHEFDLETAFWEIPGERMKMGLPHTVPLSRQAVSILRELHKVTGRGRLVFPSARGGGRPMSDNALLVAMRSLEIGKDEMSGHGFRAVARTVLDETLGFRVDIIEHQLAHAVKDANGRAYNRTSFLEERHRMMQAWADHVDELKSHVGR